MTKTREIEWRYSAGYTHHYKDTSLTRNLGGGALLQDLRPLVERLHSRARFLAKTCDINVTLLVIGLVMLILLE